VQYLLQNLLIGVLLSVSIEDVPLKQPGIPTVLSVSMVLWATVPNRVMYILKHVLSESTLAATAVICCDPYALLVSRGSRTSRQRRANVQASGLWLPQSALTLIWLFGMRRKLRNLVGSESVRIRKFHTWHWHGQSVPSAVSHYTS